MIQTRLVFLISFLFFIQVGLSQTILDAFAVQESRGGVLVSWTIGKGQTCNGIDILRSTDSLNFNVIGDIEGVCGDSAIAVSYTFNDENPPRNKEIYYRLQLGVVETSEILSIRVLDYGDNGYLAMPNPFYIETNIFFRNDDQSIHDLEIFDIQGRLVRKMTARTEQFTVPKEELNAGLYVFVITSRSSSDRISGKLLVQN